MNSVFKYEVPIADRFKLKLPKRSYTEDGCADLMEAAIAAARAEGWQAANHAWQAWLEANIPDWDAMAGIDLTTLPRKPE